MATVKNIHKLELADDMISKLEAGAAMHKRYSNIEFKILELDPKSVTVQTVQGKHLSENYADKKSLIVITKGLFESVTGLKVHVHATPYQDHVTKIVTPEWLTKQMEKYNLRVVDMVKETGLDKTNISAWVNGTRPMSQIAKTMFYYYFLTRYKM